MESIHPYEELAKFGYNRDTKVNKFKHTFVFFGSLLEPNIKNLAIFHYFKFFFFWDSGDWTPQKSLHFHTLNKKIPFLAK